MRRRLLLAWAIWSFIWAGSLVIAYLSSEGPPVCEGPLITWVDESWPPQCDEPSAALLEVGALWYALGLFPALLSAALIQAVADRKDRASTPAPAG